MLEGIRPGGRQRPHSWCSLRLFGHRQVVGGEELTQAWCRRAGLSLPASFDLVQARHPAATLAKAFQSLIRPSWACRGRISVLGGKRSGRRSGRTVSSSSPRYPSSRRSSDPNQRLRSCRRRTRRTVQMVFILLGGLRQEGESSRASSSTILQWLDTRREADRALVSHSKTATCPIGVIGNNEVGPCDVDADARFDPPDEAKVKARFCSRPQRDGRRPARR